MLRNLCDMPGGQDPLLQFVAFLIVDDQVSPTISEQLQQWGQQHSQTFSERLQQVRQQVSATQQGGDAYLMVVIDQHRSHDQKKGDRYQVKAWFVPNVQACKPGSAAGYEPLTLPNSLEKSEEFFMLKDIPRLITHFLMESGRRYVLQNLTIEFFVPSGLLSHEIERWIEDEESDFSPPIGVEHRVIVRSSERLQPAYLIRYRGKWQQKWQQLRKVVQESAKNYFILGDATKAEWLFQQLSPQTAIGLKLIQEPLKTGKGSTFAVLQATALPAALWLRQPLPTVDCTEKIDGLLSCTIADVPEVVKQIRFAALSIDLDGHIGHHLALLWEDYDRLPPDTLVRVE